LLKCKPREFKRRIQSITEKSRVNKVAWKQSQENENRFYVNLSDELQLVVANFSPKNKPDWAGASLFYQGRKVAYLYAEDGGDQELFRLIVDMVNEARRNVTGWDVALSKVDEILESKESIGKLAEDEFVEQEEPPTGDIPF
jgi:hypothetical protein